MIQNTNQQMPEELEQLLRNTRQGVERLVPFFADRENGNRIYDQTRRALQHAELVVWQMAEALEGGHALELITCAAEGCGAKFFPVAERRHPELCIDHADEADRQNGWTPENSRD